MNRQRLAANLAVSLTLGAWTPDVVSTALRRRLPSSVQKHSNNLALSLLEHLPGAYAPDPKRVAEALQYLPAFGLIYRSCARREVWPAPDLSAPVMAPTTPFAALDLPQLTTVAALADWLLIPVERLTYLADLYNQYEAHGETSINHYHYLVKRKKSGGKRLIEAPKQQLKAVQRQILRGILDKVPPHAAAYGFIKGRNCRDAAALHVGEEVVVSFDLKDFFPSVQQARVLGLFRCLGYPLGVARMLAALCTNTTPPRVLARLAESERPMLRQPHLPQGAPTSPALANLVAYPLDRRLNALAQSLGAQFTRYADDLSFSGDRFIGSILLKVVPQIVIDEGFHVQPAKTRLRSKNTRQEVTGIVVNSHPNVSRQSFDTLKAVIHACSKTQDRRLLDPSFRARLIGQLDWVEQVNPARGQKLRDLLEKAWDKRGL